MCHHRVYGEDRERRKWQAPEGILTDIGLHDGLTFVDVGCGDGFFTIPAARIVGDEGRVYALDSDEEAIALLKKRALEEKLMNIDARIGVAEDTVFCRECADFVFFSIVLHDFTDPVNVLSNAKIMLKRTGWLVDLDWKKKPMLFGPPLHIRFSEEHATALIERAGFRVVQKKEAGQFQYLIVATP
jgi:ubiquinone/menaquinone biosynthesis C-methylase UbiE